MKIHNIIKALRIKQGIKQSDVSKDIMNQSSYSRFERGERALSTDELDVILERLNIHATDLEDLAIVQNPESSMVRDLVLLRKKNQLNNDLLDHTYRVISAKKDESLRDYRNYLFLKYQFHSQSDLIDEITPEEINTLFQSFKKSAFWTNVYIKMILEFAQLYTPEQLVYLTKRLKAYPIERFSPIDSNSQHQLPYALANIADALIDYSLENPKKIDAHLLFYAKIACDKLTAILKLNPDFNCSLLLKNQLLRHEFYTAKTPEQKQITLDKIQTYIQELGFLQQLKDYYGNTIESTATIALHSMNNLLKNGVPGKTKFYFL